MHEGLPALKAIKEGKGAQSQEIVGGKEKIKGLIHVALVKGQGAWAQGNG